jgi:hypothetical protein
MLAAERYTDRVRRGLLLAPPIFVAHFLEESPGFVPWFNGHVARGITEGMFWNVNLPGLVITLVLVAAFWASRSDAALVMVIAWLSFLMLTNGIFHVTGAIVDRGYVPGLVTALGLYLPYSVWVAWQVIRGGRIPVGLVAAVAILGGLPMAIHGYRILFLGTRLF